MWYDWGVHNITVPVYHTKHSSTYDNNILHMANIVLISFIIPYIPDYLHCIPIVRDYYYQSISLLIRNNWENNRNDKYRIAAWFIGGYEFIYIIQLHCILTFVIIEKLHKYKRNVCAGWLLWISECHTCYLFVSLHTGNCASHLCFDILHNHIL